MIKLTRNLSSSSTFDATLSLPIDIRVRSRSHVQLDDGREAGIFLDRGSLLRNGDLLTGDNGLTVKVVAANETVSTVCCDDALRLMKAAYHLGNRHIPLQIEKNWLRYQHDHVIDDMLIQMGLNVKVEQAAFEPEVGAYQQQSTHGHHHS